MMHSLTASNALHKARKADDMGPPIHIDIIEENRTIAFLPTSLPTNERKKSPHFRDLFLFCFGQMAPGPTPPPPGRGEGGRWSCFASPRHRPILKDGTQNLKMGSIDRARNLGRG